RPAERHLRVGRADGRVAEEDAGGDLLHVVELHLGDGRRVGRWRPIGGGVYGQGERPGGGGEQEEALGHGGRSRWECGRGGEPIPRPDRLQAERAVQNTGELTTESQRAQREETPRKTGRQRDRIQLSPPS